MDSESLLADVIIAGLAPENLVGAVDAEQERLEKDPEITKLDDELAGDMPPGWTVPEVSDTDDGDKGDGGEKGEGGENGATDEADKNGDGKPDTEGDGATFMTASAAAIVLGAMLQ